MQVFVLAEKSSHPESEEPFSCNHDEEILEMVIEGHPRTWFVRKAGVGCC